MQQTAPLTDAETRTLRALAALMILASAEYRVPGADDETIFADILRSFGRDLAPARAGLRRLDELAGGVFADLDAARAMKVAGRFRAEGGEPLAALSRTILLCYYRDDRVMISLGMEPRPPFPKGHVVEQGDWSLLDPVRRRAPFWRKARRRRENAAGDGGGVSCRGPGTAGLSCSARAPSSRAASGAGWSWSAPSGSRSSSASGRRAAAPVPGPPAACAPDRTAPRPRRCAARG